MDINVLIMLMAFSLVLLVLAFMGRRAGWGFLGFMGMTVVGVSALALFNDGSLTNASFTLAAANGNFVSDFNAIEVMVISVGFGEGWVTIRKVFHI